MQYHSIHKNTTETDGVYISKGWVQSLHASPLVSSFQHNCVHLHAHYFTSSCQPLPADVIYTSRFQISCISVVTILMMLMHEGCCTIKCGSMTCWNYDGTCDGGRILVI